jgi:hypothetical protein
MPKFFNVKITQGVSDGPYDIYYTTTGSSTYQYSKLYGTNNNAALLTYSGLTTGDGVSVEVPLDVAKIVIFNLADDCEHEVTHYVVTPTPTPTQTITLTPTPTLTQTVTPTSTTGHTYSYFLGVSTSNLGNFIGSLITACSAEECVNNNNLECIIDSTQQAFFNNQTPEIDDLVYTSSGSTLPGEYDGYYLIDFPGHHMIIEIRDGVVTSFPSCSTPTTTPTVTTTPSETPTNTPTPSPTIPLPPSPTVTPTVTVTSSGCTLPHPTLTTVFVQCGGDFTGSSSQACSIREMFNTIGGCTLGGTSFWDLYRDSTGNPLIGDKFYNGANTCTVFSQLNGYVLMQGATEYIVVEVSSGVVVGIVDCSPTPTPTITTTPTLTPTITPTETVTPTITPTNTQTVTPTPSENNAVAGQFIYVAQTGILWNGYGSNFLSFGRSQDGTNKTPLAGWYFIDSNNVVRQLLNTPVWFSGGNPSPWPNGIGWIAVANGSFSISSSQTTITFYETSPV